MSQGIVVLGIGNPLVQDDGIGIAALDLLGQSFTFSPEIELVDGGTQRIRLARYCAGPTI
jgi:hydrogenase maturation protease